jgi:signal peptidase I
VVEASASQPESHASSAAWLKRLVVGRNPRVTLIRVLVLVAVITPLFAFVLLPVRIQGISMMPTCKENRINFMNRLAYKFHDPRRGDIVGIRTTGMRILYLKRIVALPGETIEMHQGRVYINGQFLPEPYLKYPCDWERPAQTLGADEYYLVGDNRSMPRVDHYEGIAQRSRIVGKLLL